MATTGADEQGFYGTPAECYVCTEQGPASEAEVLCSEHAPWQSFEYEFTATPTTSQAVADAITDVLGPLGELYRPTHRSRIAWADGSLTYLYEVTTRGMHHEAAVAALAKAELVAT